MTPSIEPSIQTFFENFERRSAAGDAEGLASLYTASFLMAGPDGTQIVRASDFLHAIPKRKQLLEAAGCKSTTLVSLIETQLDDRYIMVRTEWRWQFERGADAPAEITLPSTFVVERYDEGLRIVFYLRHADVMVVLRERGLLLSSD